MRMRATAKLAEAGTTYVGQDNPLGGGSVGGVRVGGDERCPAAALPTSPETRPRIPRIWAGR
jgi:hypothetical protein